MNNSNKIDIEKMRPIIVGTSWLGYYGFGNWLGKPGKIHKTLDIKIKDKE